MGVVYHSNYLVYFEVGRTEWLRAHGMAYSDLERSGVHLAVTEVGCKYLAPLRYDEVARVETWVSDVGKTRITFRYRLHRTGGNDATFVAEGFSTLACLTPEGKPQRIPDTVRAVYDTDGSPPEVAP